MHRIDPPLFSLLVDGDEAHRERMKGILGPNFIVKEVKDIPDAIKALIQEDVDFTLLRVGEESPQESIVQLKAFTEKPILLIVERYNPNIIREALEAGAIDFFLDSDSSTTIIRRCIAVCHLSRMGEKRSHG